MDCIIDGDPAVPAGISPGNMCAGCWRNAPRSLSAVLSEALTLLREMLDMTDGNDF